MNSRRLAGHAESMRWLWILLGLVLGLGTLGACGPGGLRTRPTTTGEDDTRLGEGDRFDVRVYGEADLSANYQVARDGTIDYPYIGRIEVAELEPTEVARLIASRLREGGVLVDPQVSVVVTDQPSKRISVIGAVRNPGNFPLSAGLTAVQAIGLAGGFTDLANRDGTIVTRRVNGQMRRYSVPVDQITIGAQEDFRIQARDIIFVPERPF